MLGYTYDSPAVIPDGTAAPSVDDQQVDYVPTARPGHRAPHFWVDRKSTRCSIIDLYGSGFVLLAGPEGSVRLQAAERVRTRFSAPLRTYLVGGEQADLFDPDARWSDLYCTRPDGAVLVRPDGHVAWRSANVPADPESALLDAVAAVLARSPSEVISP